MTRWKPGDWAVDKDFEDRNPPPSKVLAVREGEFGTEFTLEGEDTDTWYLAENHSKVRNPAKKTVRKPSGPRLSYQNVIERLAFRTKHFTNLTDREALLVADLYATTAERVTQDVEQHMKTLKDID